MSNTLVLGPIFIPFAGAILCLILAKNNLLQRRIGLVISLLAMLASWNILAVNMGVDGVVQIYRLGGWFPPYGIVFVADMLAALFSTMASTVMFGGMLYVYHSTDKASKYPAFVSLFLFMQTGLSGALLTGDIFTMFVFLEVMVLSSVSLVGISDDKYGPEAAIKYIFISAMGTLFLLLGIAALYATFGSLNFAQIAEELASGQRPLLARASAVMLMCAFLLKSAVFPFHFWQPDFHTTAPTAVSAMLSSIVVKVGVYGIIRVVTLLFVQESHIIENWLVLLGIIGIFFGSLGALRTYNGKRMLAYSTFGQIGFILVGIGWGSPLAMVGAIIYTINHAFIKSSLLLLMGTVASFTEDKTATLLEIEGVGKSIPIMIGILYFLGGLALAGIPPMNGFISKLALVRGGISTESWIPLVLVVSSGILTMIYMMRSWQNIFQKAPTEHTATLKESLHGDNYLAPALLIMACLFLGLYAQPLVEVATQTVEQINRPIIYITAVGFFGGQ